MHQANSRTQLPETHTWEGSVVPQVDKSYHMHTILERSQEMHLQWKNSGSIFIEASKKGGLMHHSENLDLTEDQVSTQIWQAYKKYTSLKNDKGQHDHWLLNYVVFGIQSPSMIS